MTVQKNHVKATFTLDEKTIGILNEYAAEASAAGYDGRGAKSALVREAVALLYGRYTAAEAAALLTATEVGE